MYYFIVNPNSRSGRGRSIWNEIHQQLMLRGIDFQYCLTRYSGHAAEIASDACALGTESEPVYIIAVGGDGTIHEVLTGITDFDRVVFGYIPTGSGNDFCRSMRLPFDPMESLEYILKAEHIFCLPTAFFGKHVGIRGIHILTCSDIHVHSASALPIHIDGESGGIREDLTVSIEKSSLKIILPVV